MSKSTLADFLSALSEDSDLRGQLRSIAVGEGDEPAVLGRDLVAFAASKGFHFSVEDLSADLELSDDELESVAGGIRYESLNNKYPENMKHEVVRLPISRVSGDL